MDERKQFLLALISAAMTQHDAWANQPDLVYVTPEVDAAMTDLLDGFAAGDIPSSCRQLQVLVTDFGDLWQAWQREVDRGPTTSMPSQGVWAAYERLVAAYKGVTAPSPPQVESIATLRRQNVPDYQICQIYGWIDDMGRPEIRKIEEELESPGKHTTGWVDPIQIKRQEAERKTQSLSDRVRLLRDRKLARAAMEAPETLEDLCYQKVPMHQVCEMLRLSEADILVQCQAKGLPLPPSSPSHHATQGSHTPDINGSTARQLAAREAEGDRMRAADAAKVEADLEDAGTDDGPAVSIEQQIVELHLAGFESKDIAKELSTAEERVSMQKVAAVIRRHNEDPASVGV